MVSSDMAGGNPDPAHDAGASPGGEWNSARTSDDAATAPGNVPPRSGPDLDKRTLGRTALLTPALLGLVLLLAFAAGSTSAVVAGWIGSSGDRCSTIPVRGVIDLNGCDLTATDLTGARLDGALLRGAILNGVDLRGRSMRGSHLEGASLAGARLEGTRLDGAHLEGADLRGAALDQACLAGAQLARSDARGATGNPDVRGAELRGAVGWPQATTPPSCTPAQK